MASLSIKRRTRSKYVTDVTELAQEKINIVYNFDQSKVHLLNTYTETLEDKLNKVLVITGEISILTEDDEEYEIGSQTAMDI